MLKYVPTEKWSSVILAYDNMCHLDGLKAARSPLPLPEPYNNMWTAITKVYVIAIIIRVCAIKSSPAHNSFYGFCFLGNRPTAHKKSCQPQMQGAVWTQQS